MKVEKSTDLRSPRPNQELATLHKNAAALLRKLAKVTPDSPPLKRDLAMAEIYATQLDRRRRH